MVNNTLMKVMEVKTATYKFHPTEKVFVFGGGARREAAWSVSLFACLGTTTT